MKKHKGVETSGDGVGLVRMPQLHKSLHFHLTPTLSLDTNGSSHRDLILNSQNFLSLHPRKRTALPLNTYRDDKRLISP